ncbi:phosphotransferase family protein [Gorillibacterium timonense]|uniref:phosphotransferase family protein n=1 Tax=Gorillibacterium timonense TaxID=1689269 RepID=UPI00071C42D8|nr:aminoglycoside phosphotransferase family protein [Gorillibacterium timonense]
MNSTMKSKLTIEQIQRITAETMKEKVVSLKELSDGWANTAYAIQLEDDRKVILKAAPVKGFKTMRCERDNMRAEVEALRLVQAQSNGVPIPQVYTYDPSGSLVPCEYFLMEYLEGEPYNKVKEALSPEARDGIEFALGDYNRRINAIQGKRFGYFCLENGSASTWKDAFQILMEDLLLDGKEAGIELPLSYEALEREVESRLDACSEVNVPQLVHWDLWDGNVFVKDERIVGIIDFERSLWADPLMEVYFGKFNSSSTAYRRGYGKEHFTEAERVRRDLYVLYLDLVMVIECYYRQYENKDHIAWAHSNLKEGLEALKMK